MKVLSVLSLLFLSYEYVHAYDYCKGCNVVSVEEGESWGVENNDWCIIKTESCNKDDDKNKCFSFPDYPCCTGCNVIEEDGSGKWGVENDSWCGIKDSCNKSQQPDQPTVPVDDHKNKYCINPRDFAKDMYTADPAPMVYGDTLYVYTSHDENNLKNNFYTMLDWYCFSTKDMKNWTNHGKVFALSDLKWADDRAWAPQVVPRNGKFYMYVPVHKRNGGMAIGVGISDKPTGPFKDIGHPLIDEGDWNDIDPTVYIDDDGQAYLYFGNPQLRYVLLNEDMVSYNKQVGIVKNNMTADAFGRGRNGSSSYGEGPWFYKRNNKYYMVYAAFRQGGNGSECLSYSTSDKPTGPWKYGGVIMTEEGGTFTNHPGVIDFRGHSYLFYHTQERQGGSSYHRSVGYVEFEYNKDGSIPTIPKCKNTSL